MRLFLELLAKSNIYGSSERFPFARLHPKELLYLCNWYVKLVRPGKEIPDDQFQCVVPMKMTKFDIKNYFEKIYDIRVFKVNTRIQIGKVKTVIPGSKEKKKLPDYKVAYVTMVDQTFKYPNIFDKYEADEQEEESSSSGGERT